MVFGGDGCEKAGGILTAEGAVDLFTAEVAGVVFGGDGCGLGKFFESEAVGSGVGFTMGVASTVF